MRNIEQIINDVEKEWFFPKKAVHNNKETLMEFKCVVYRNRKDFFVTKKMPNDLVKFWQIVERATLFLDNDYGQWGLHLFSYTEALKISKVEKISRPNDYLSTDLIIGEFIGDSEKLVIDCSINNFGNVMISLPMDSRDDWYIVSNSFLLFLDLYTKNQGKKFWER